MAYDDITNFPHDLFWENLFVGASEDCVNAKIFLQYFGPFAPFFVKLEVLDRFLEFYWLKSVNFARNFEIFLTFLKNEFQNKILVLN